MPPQATLWVATVDSECLCVERERQNMGNVMPEHGHVVCPHCETGLEGAEATCPGCSGPLFGIAPKPSSNSNSSTTTIGDVSVPTYTPPATEEQIPH